MCYLLIVIVLNFVYSQQ